MSADPGEVRVRLDGGRLPFGWGEDRTFPRWSAAVDVATGKASVYRAPDQLPPQGERQPACSSSQVVATTADGPLVAMGREASVCPATGSGKRSTPTGRSKDRPLVSWNGTVYGVAGHQLLVGWSTGGRFGDDADPVWSVHDLQTGKFHGCGIGGLFVTRDDEQEHADLAASRVLTGPLLGRSPVPRWALRPRCLCRLASAVTVGSP